MGLWENKVGRGLKVFFIYKRNSTALPISARDMIFEAIRDNQRAFFIAPNLTNQRHLRQRTSDSRL